MSGKYTDVTLYSDGSCLRNPGPGGWASILVCEGHEKILSGGRGKTTNNHMELLGVLEGLKALKYPCKVKVVTDSQYVVNSINKGWLKNWIARKEIKSRPNSELWLELIELMNIHDVEYTWIKGHAGHPFNERCDKIARTEASRFDTL